MGQKFFCVFQTFLNSPQNSEYFELRHLGEKKIPPSRRAKKFFGAFRATLSSKISNWRKAGSKTLGGVWRAGGGGGGGSWEFEAGRPPRCPACPDAADGGVFLVLVLGWTLQPGPLHARPRRAMLPRMLGGSWLPLRVREATGVVPVLPSR